MLGGKQDGWYRSGDLMRQDGAGNIWFVSRLNDPAVRDAAVIGTPDPLLGQRVLGFIRLNNSVDVGQLGDILGSAATRLAAYKLPERLLVIAEIPRNGLGKIDRKRLAAQMPLAVA